MAKTLAIVFGAIFLLVGVLGFIENPLVGPGALFHTDMMHNIVHLLFGVILLAVALMAAHLSALWLKILGLVYLLLAVLGFLMVPEGGMLLGLIETNHADHWLHTLLGVAMVAAGFMYGKAAAPVSRDMPPPVTGGM